MGGPYVYRKALTSDSLSTHGFFWAKTSPPPPSRWRRRWGGETAQQIGRSWRVQVPPGCGSGRGQKAVGMQLDGGEYVIKAPEGTRVGDTIWVRLEGEKVRHLARAPQPPNPPPHTDRARYPALYPA